MYNIIIEKKEVIELKNVYKFILVLIVGFVLISFPNNSEAATLNEELKGLETAIKAKNWTNAALYSGRIAQKYDDAKNYNQAVKYYEMSAAYWEKTAHPDWGVQGLNRSKEIKTDIELYVEKPIELGYTLGKYEPFSGVYLGLYTAGVLESQSYGEMDFSKVKASYNKNHAMYLTYKNWSKNGLEAFPTSYAQRIKDQGSALQIALQPTGGLDVVKDTEAIREFARQAQAMDMPIFIRFAGEMNGEWVPWYDSTGKKYIEKFRLIHDIFEKEAPNVAMVWAPNFYPYWNSETFYPGDNYVDWVGISLYTAALSSTAKEQLGTSPITYMKEYYDRYSRKPMMVVEGAISHYSYRNSKDYTTWAITQLHNMYSYMPKMFPKLKAITYFNLDKKSTQVLGDNENNNFDIGKNAEYLAAYKKIISGNFYYDSLTLDGPSNQIKTEYTTVSKLREGSGSHNAFVYVKLPFGEAPYYVAVYQNNKKVAETYAAPWELKLNLTNLDTSKPVVVKAFNSKWVVVGEKEFKLSYKKVSELSNFTDVSATHWAFKDIKSAVSEGVINGYMGKFSPDNKITVRDFVAILARSYGEKDQISNSSYNADVQNYMSVKNYPYVTTNSKNITRTQAAEIIAASQGVNLTGDDAIKYLLVNKLSTGKASTISVSNYFGNDLLTRAETVKFIANVKANGNEAISARPTTVTDPKEVRNQYNQLFNK